MAFAVLRVTLPLEYVRPDEKVVVAVQVGTPETSARTWPLVPAEVVATAPVPFPYKSAPDWSAAQPVPPFATPSTPEMSDVSETSEVAIEPAVAFRMPESDPILRDPKNPFVDEAYANDASEVEELVNVCNAVKVFAVYVFGIVVEALMYEFTPLEKSETCEFVMERLLSVVIEFTDEVAARLPMNEVVARAVVK